MNLIEASLFVLLIAIISVPIANRFRLSLEVFLLIGSCMISFIPGLPVLRIDPVIVFDIFLPPILFYAAYFTSLRDFKLNLRPIVLLAFGLVIFTATVIATVAVFILPGFTWAEGFLLGAIVSPTDASAATSIIKKLGAPRRMVALLEGESLVNDATALILYRFSLGAVMYGSFSLPQAAMNFAMISLGGVIVGLIIGRIAAYILAHLRDTSAETAFSFITAFSSYLIAEHLGVSGVISTVVCGIYFGLHFAELVPSNTRISAKASWDTLLFIINGFVFAMIGLQLPTVMRNLGSVPIQQLLFYGATVSFFVVLTRLLWMYPAAYIPRLIFPKIALNDPMPPWQFLFALGWTGMRGIVSLAAVLAVPLYLPRGAHFPHLDLLIFICYCVIVVTLIVPTLTLPPLLRYLHLSEAIDNMKEEATARVRITEEVFAVIKTMINDKQIPKEIYDEFIHQFERKLKVIRTQLSENPYSMLATEYFAYKKLMLLAIKTERITLQRLRKSGEIHEEIYRKLTFELDLEEMRAKTLRM